MSPRSVALYQTDAPGSIVTSPMRHAVGATHASGATTGRFPWYGYRGTVTDASRILAVEAYVPRT